MTNPLDALKGRRILVVEDDFFMVADLLRELEQAGVEVVGPAPSVAKATHILEQEAPLDAAILDLNVQGEMVFPFADLLIERNVPFVFLTGYDRDVIPTRFSTIKRCEKPLELPPLATALFGHP
jgi:two-component SAPR family response regulator